MSKIGDSNGLGGSYIRVRTEEYVNLKIYGRESDRKKVEFMKLKKILFTVFCSAILLCTGVVCLASADDDGISAYSTSTYNDGDVVYKDVRLRAFGYSQVPASISQIVNPSSTKKTYFGETAVIRSWSSTIYDEDINNKAVTSGKVLTASIAQNRDGHYFYEHDVILHAGETASTPIVKKLIKGYGF